MTSQGDPAALGRAKLSGVGVLIGLVIIGSSVLIPASIDRVIVAPSGGISVSENLSTSCDRLFRSRLVGDRSAHDMASMQRLIRDIQATSDDCAIELWSPEVGRLQPRVAADCFLGIIPRPGGGDALIGGQLVPRGLRSPGAGTVVSIDSSRDELNNILIYFSNSKYFRPSDDSACWLYHARNGAWSEQ